MGTVPRNRLKAALAEGRVQVGLWLYLASPVVAEMAAGAGFDWCLIDAEHGPNDVAEILTQVQAMEGRGAEIVVRVPEADPWILKRVLDLGVQTVLVPMVDSAAEAEAVVAACRYPPLGRRGMGGPGIRANRWGGIAGYETAANAEICVLVQAESRAGIENVAAIAAVEGIDGVFVGPGDLSADMGHVGDLRAPEVVEAITGALAAIRAAGKAAGIIDGDPKAQAAWIEAGVTFLGVGADMITLAAGLRALAAETRTLPGAAP